MQIGDIVRIRLPFSDDQQYLITATMAIDSEGNQVVDDTAEISYFQYEVNDSYYIEDHLELVN